MMATLELVFFGVLATSTLVATCAMIINFPHIRASQQMMLAALNGLDETYRLGFEALTLELNRLDERVQELEIQRFEGQPEMKGRA
jgi:hypothetical protein